MPLARYCIQVPVGEDEVGILALLYLGRPRLQVLSVVHHLLPVVELEVLMLACEHHLMVHVTTLLALHHQILLPNDLVEDLLPRFFLGHDGSPY